MEGIHAFLGGPWVVDSVYLQVVLSFITFVQPIELENQVSPYLGFQAKFTQS